MPVGSGTKVEDFVVEFLMHSFCVIGGELKEASDNLSKLPVLPEGPEAAFDEWCARERFNVLHGEAEGAVEADVWSWSV